jgi:predicted DNA binding CopG/RHH family protein
VKTLKRLARIYVRLSKVEEAALRAEAEDMGLTMSDYIRHIISAYRGTQATQKEQPTETSFK